MTNINFFFQSMNSGNFVSSTTVVSKHITSTYTQESSRFYMSDKDLVSNASTPQDLLSIFYNASVDKE